MTEYCRRIESMGSRALDRRFALPSSERRYAPDRDFDATHIKIEIALDIARRSFDAVCTTTLRAFSDASRTAVFDAVGFRIRSVTLDGRKARFAYDGRSLCVTVPRATAGRDVEIAVRYRVTRPKLGMYFIAPDASAPDLPAQVWTQGQDEYNRYWFPCHDAPQEKATTELVATVPRGFFVVGNGGLVSTRHDDARKTSTYHWKMTIPHATYLVTLAAGRFVEIRDEWDGIPITYYTEKGREDDARRAFGNTPAMVKFFSEAIGVRYPYEKYAQVAASCFIYGGMENTSATTQTDLVLHDERAHAEAWHDGLVAHELAHQWFGDLVTCRDWSHAWLNESFATYFDALFHEHHYGADEFRYQMWQNAQLYLKEDRDRYRRPIVTNLYRDPSDLFDRHLYEKGSCVLHMLRSLLGDSLFWRSIRTYVEEHGGHSVETLDLIDAIETATGKNLRWFFDQWVFRAGHPELRVVYGWDGRRRRADVWIAQVQPSSDETPVFRMPVALRFQLPGGGVVSFTEELKGREQSLSFKLLAEPEMFLFDADGVLLMEVEETKPPAMWRAQLARDPHVCGRIRAAQELARAGTPEALETLAAALQAEPFWGVKAEIARALGSVPGPESRAALEKALALPNPKARRAVVEAIGKLGGSESVPALQRALEARDSYDVPAEACRAIARSRGNVAKILEKQLGVPSWNDAIRIGAIQGLAALGDLETAVRHTRPGASLPCRSAAIRALAAGRGRRDVADVLLGLLGDPNLRIRHAAIATLGQIGDPRAVPALRAVIESRDIDTRLRRAAEEAIRAIRFSVDELFDADTLRAQNERLRQGQRDRVKAGAGGAS